MLIDYLKRPFVYRNRKNIDEFLVCSQLWCDLYDIFLDVKDNQYHFKVPSVRFFNEVYYQCVLLWHDKHPEENIWDNYLNPVKAQLETRYASDLCFCMVYAVLSLQSNPPLQIPRFCKILSKKFEDDQFYFKSFDNYVYQESSKGISYELDFSFKPEPPSFFKHEMELDVYSQFPRMTLAYNMKKWKKITDDFEQEKIRDLIMRWPTQEERLEMLNMIEDAFNKDEFAQDKGVKFPDSMRLDLNNTQEGVKFPDDLPF